MVLWINGEAVNSAARQRADLLAVCEDRKLVLKLCGTGETVVVPHTALCGVELAGYDGQDCDYDVYFRVTGMQATWMLDGKLKHIEA